MPGLGFMVRLYIGPSYLIQCFLLFVLFFLFTLCVGVIHLVAVFLSQGIIPYIAVDSGFPQRR